MAARVELTDAAATERALEQVEPEVIVNAAALTDVDVCARFPERAHAVNAEVPATLARVARRLGAHLVHLSTDYVFDGKAGPYDEEAAPAPLGAYGQSKLRGEEAVRALAGSHAIARTAIVYGWPAPSRPNFGTFVLGELLAKRPVRLFEDQWITPSAVSSVARMLAELVETKRTGTWNVCGAQTVSRVEFGRALCEVFCLDASLLTPVPMKSMGLAERPARAGLIAEKARRALVERPMALRPSLEAFRDEWHRAIGSR
jgi:dTDP-4-dehydrorhamnose reductase